MQILVKRVFMQNKIKEKKLGVKFRYAQYKKN